MAHDALWQAIDAVRVQRPHTSCEAEVAEAAARPRHALTPWALWLLIAVARHARRQQRVVEIFHRHLGVDLAKAAREGWRGPPKGVPPQGTIDASGYRLHERGVAFRDGHRHELLEINLREGDPDHVDVDGLARFFEAYGGYDGDERLVALHESLEAIELAADELVELGLLTSRAGAPRYMRLSDEAAPHAAALMEVGSKVGRESPGGAHFSDAAAFATLGDWIAADAVARQHEGLAPWMRVFTAPRAAEQKAARRERLLAEKYVDRDGTVITALIELDAMEAAPHVRAALAGPRDRRCCTAIRQIRGRQHMTWVPQPDYAADVLALLRRLDLEGENLDHLIWKHCAGYLLERGVHVDEVLATFAGLGDMLLVSAALLSFRYLPELGVPLVRRALHASNPVARADAVAILAVLHEPWCASMLAEALATLGELARERTLEWRVGLRMLGDPEGALRAWDQSHPPTREDSAALERSEKWIRERMGAMASEVRRPERQKVEKTS